MSTEFNIRWNWIKGMYVYTIVGAGGFGLGMLFIPEVIQSVFRFPGQDPVVFGVVGSIYVALGLLSLLGLRAPLNFVPILLLELCYKVIWIIAIFFTAYHFRRTPGAFNSAPCHICDLHHRRSDRHPVFLRFFETIRCMEDSIG